MLPSSTRRFICIFSLAFSSIQLAACSTSEQIHSTGPETQRKRGVQTVPALEDEIDLDSMDGLDQLTRLVLLKTDSLPGKSDRLDARYLNALMETLYTGLRKPFKSVSADILGIFPTLEFLNISCETPAGGDVGQSRDQHQAIIRRRSPQEPSSNGSLAARGPSDESYAPHPELDQSNHKSSSVQVCRAVTNDCLSMSDLVQILPNSITSSHSLLARLCPVILFRLMSNICRRDTELISAYQKEAAAGGGQEQVETITNKEALNLNKLQILKSLQSSDESNSKRPQKLHKKLKTQTSYQSEVNIKNGALKHRQVDEQLLKIKLKLSEPSIEKVWIFSLLFVVLSIVVSMGGLIVLPFVKKTTRRRILTLFEGLAVGGLTGSATLHMFPQAFGLVDENYHKYFWRIFVVFLGIYLCYLCERTIKILKVVRSKRRRRSCASLTGMDFRYGFPSISRDVQQQQQQRAQCQTSSLQCESNQSNQLDPQAKGWGKKRPQSFQESIESRSSRYLVRMKLAEPKRVGIGERFEKEKRKRAKKESGLRSRNRQQCEQVAEQTKSASGSDSLKLEPLSNSMAPTRERLVRCLKSVRSEFSPVYVVFNQPDGDQKLDQKSAAAGRKSARRAQEFVRTNESSQWNGPRTGVNMRRNRLFEEQQRIATTTSSRSQESGAKSMSSKRQAKHEEMETMLYHRNLIEQQSRDEANLNERYQRHRLSDVNDLTGERQDQNDPARMSVDTVSWMILFGDGLLNVIDGLSIGAAFERNILAGISISVAVMLEEVTHRLGTTAILIRTGFSIKQSFICTFFSACALFPGMIIGIMLSDATDEATPYIFCAAGGIFLYTGLVDVMKEMNRSIENAMRKDIRTTLKIFALQNIGIVVAVVFLSFLALYEPDFEEYQKILNKD